RSVRDRHRSHERGAPPPRRRHTRRPAVFQTRHHRLRVCAWRFQPSDHPRPRRQSRRDHRERNWQQRRVGSGRRSLRTHRSDCDQTGPTRAFNGGLPNCAAQADGGSIGGSNIFDGGFIGAAIAQTDALYHIPGIDGADHLTRIDAHQTKFTTKGEYRPDAAAIEAVRFWAGAVNYKHNEIGLADTADLTTLGVRQTFTNKEQEGRLEVQMMPFNARFAAVTTAFGLQAGHQVLTAPSPDDPGSPLNGLWDPNRNNRVAGYVFNELKFSETTKAQIAGRLEHVNLSGTMPSFIPAV